MQTCGVIIKNLTERVMPQMPLSGSNASDPLLEETVTTPKVQSNEMQSPSVNTKFESASPVEEVVTSLKDQSNETQCLTVTSAAENAGERDLSCVNGTAKNAIPKEEMASTSDDKLHEMQPSDMNRAVENGIKMQFPCVNKTVGSECGEEGAALKDQPNTMKDSESTSVPDEMIATVKDSVASMESFDMGKDAESNTAPEETGTTLMEWSDEHAGVSRAMKNACELQSSSENVSVMDDMVALLENSDAKMPSACMVKAAENNTIYEEMGTTLKNRSSEMQLSGVNKAMENASKLQPCCENGSVQDEMEGSATEMQSSGIRKLAEKAIIPEEMGTELKNGSSEKPSSGANSTVESTSEFSIYNGNIRGQLALSSIETCSFGVNISEKTESKFESTSDETMTDCEDPTVSPITVHMISENTVAMTVSCIAGSSLSEETDSEDSFVSNITTDGSILGKTGYTVSHNVPAEKANSCVLTECYSESVQGGMSLLKDNIPTRGEASERNSKRLQPSKETNQPHKKKIRLDKGIQIEEMVTTPKCQSNEMQSSSVNTTLKSASPMEEVVTSLKDQPNKMQCLTVTAVNTTAENASERDLSCVNRTAKNAIPKEEMASTSDDQLHGMQPSDMNRAVESGIKMQFPCVNKTDGSECGEEVDALKDQPNCMKDSESTSVPDEMIATVKDSVASMESFDMGKDAESNTAPEETGTTLIERSDEHPGVSRAMKNACELQSSSENVSVMDDMVALLENSDAKMPSACMVKAAENNTIYEEMGTTLKNRSGEMQPSGVNKAMENASKLQPCCENGSVQDEMEGSATEMQSSGIRKLAEKAIIPEEMGTELKNGSSEKPSSGANSTVESTSEFSIYNGNIRGQLALSSIETCSFGVTISEKTESKLESTSDKTMTDCEVPIVSPITVHTISENTVAMTVSCIAGCSLSEETDSADSDDSFVSNITTDGSTSGKTGYTVSHNVPADKANPCVLTECYSESLQGGVSLLKDMPTRGEASGRKSKRLQPFEKTNQPPYKKIRLDKGIAVSVKDILGGMHTRLCGSTCSSKHNPLVLAVGVADDCKMRTCLENHFKLSIKYGWHTSRGIQDPSSMLFHLVVQMAVLFGKCDLLEIMLEVCLGSTNVFASFSPLFTVLRNINHFMSSSSFDDKVEGFQQMLRLLTKYDCSVLLARDVSCQETILHVCAKKIRDLTNEINTQDSFTTDSSQHEGLLSQRKLCEHFFTAMIHTFQRLCTGGCFHQSSVLEFFDCKSLSGETMSDILEDEKLIRNGCNVRSQTLSPVAEEEPSEDARKQVTVKVSQSGRKDKEGVSSLTAGARIPILSQSSDLQSIHPIIIPDVSESTNGVNLFGNTTVSSNSISVQRLREGTSGSASSTVSVSMLSTQTAKTVIPNVSASTDEVNPSGTTTVSASSPSAPRLGNGASGSASSAVFVAMLSPQTAKTVMPNVSLCTNEGTPSGNTSLSTSSPSILKLSRIASCSTSPAGSVSRLSAQTLTTRGQTTRTSGDQTDSPFLELNTETMKTSIGSKEHGKHTFLCNPNCSIQHHELIQLLSATPDHDSLMLPAVEKKSCSNFRNYLQQTSWDFNAVVLDPLPKLCYSIIHLACLLGKYKALEVLSEFGFHPLIHSAITEETPLHMTVHFLNYHSSGGLFLCESVISILKILNRHSHAISLFSAKDYKGNTVLHSLANLLSSKKCLVHHLTTVVYLFRTFARFLLGECNSPAAVPHQILSSTLSECNKKGESVESMLKRSVVGKKLLTDLLALTETSSEGNVVNQNSVECSSQYCPSGPSEPDETESLLDFLLSSASQITGCSSDDIRMLAESYHGEYDKREQFLQQKVQSLQKEIKSEGKLRKSAKNLDRELLIMKSSIEWNNCRLKSAKIEKKTYEWEYSINRERVLLLEELQENSHQWRYQHPEIDRFF